MTAMFVWMLVSSLVISSFVGVGASFSIPLPLRNVDVLENHVREISNISNSRYGEWMSVESIRTLTSPIEIPHELCVWMDENELACKQEDDILSCPGDPTTFTTLPEPYFISGYVRSRTQRMFLVRQSPTDDTPYVVPQTLASYYNVPTGSHGDVSIGPVEFQGYGAFMYSDAVTFEQQTGVSINYPSPDHIIGPFYNSSAAGESSLDFDVIAGLVPNATVWYWTEPSWIFDWAHRMFLREDVPQVVSLSWGWSEDDQCQIIHCNHSYAYVNRTNNELLRLAARGITIVVSSGDAGSPGRTSEDCSNGVHAIFPGSSPWVTAVGATSLRNPTPLKDGPPFCDTHTCMGGGEEGMCYLNGPGGCFWTGGGGISNATQTPWYQTKQVAAYVDDHTVPKPHLYRKDGRGYPDVALMAHNYFVMIGGVVSAVDGTSASAPAFASMVARLNSELLARGRPLLGFVTPLLYHLGEHCDNCFHSINGGNNNCTEQSCCSFGYSSKDDTWDAVTGWGSPNIGNILKYIL